MVATTTPRGGKRAGEGLLYAFAAWAGCAEGQTQAETSPKALGRGAYPGLVVQMPRMARALRQKVQQLSRLAAICLRPAVVPEKSEAASCKMSFEIIY